MDYLNINLRAPTRLNILKKAADRANERYNKYGIGHGRDDLTWRDMRFSTFANFHANRITLTKGEDRHGDHYWYCHTDLPFPRVKFADDVVSLDHTGWFSDVLGCTTIRGAVIFLPKGRILAATYESDSGEWVVYPRIYDCERDAAYAADSTAQHDAEEQREYDTAWRAGDMWRELREENDQLRAKVRALIPEIRRTKFSDVVCAALTEKLQEWLYTLQGNKNDMARLEDGDYSEFIFYPSSHLMVAFNGGAGRS